MASLDSVLNLSKRRSETPLQTVERYVKAHPEYKGEKMTYAGRLDPMAEGLLLVLSGEKNKEREAYTGLDKDYEFEFMLGVDTDTFDVLGKVTAQTDAANVDIEKIKEISKEYVGKFNQVYPAYSSKVVAGKQLFEHARTGTLSTIDLPKHEVEVKALEILSVRTASSDEIKKYILDGIAAVTGDFRQAEIAAAWEEYFASAPAQFSIYKARVSCGSGFYVRQFVSDLGRDLGTGAVTISILRTRVGEYKLADSIK